MRQAVYSVDALHATLKRTFCMTCESDRSKGPVLKFPWRLQGYSFYRKVIFFHPQKEQNTQVSRTCATKKELWPCVAIQEIELFYLILSSVFFLILLYETSLFVCRLQLTPDSGQARMILVDTCPMRSSNSWKKACKRFRKAAIGISTLHFCPFCRLPIGPRQAEKSMESPTFGRAFWLLWAAWPLTDRSNLSFHGLRIGWQLGSVVQAPFFSWWS